MLRIYIGSILIYMIIIAALAYIGQYKIKENGWLDGEKKKGNPYVYLFCLSAIPIFRLFCVISIFIMIAMTKENFEKFTEEMSNESN